MRAPRPRVASGPGPARLPTAAASRAQAREPAPGRLALAATLALGAALALSSPAPARAQEGPPRPPAAGGASSFGDAPYQPVGAPADPKVEVRWNRYHDYAEATALLAALARAFPSLARLDDLGLSTGGGRSMWALTIHNPATGAESEKSAFYIDGGIHANELQGPEVALYTAWFLLESYGRSPFITRLVDERVFYIVPMLSPDGRDVHMHTPATTHSPRSGVMPVDDDLDGAFDEDGPDDLDGDGHIAEMRIRDPNGRWKPHPRYPALMVECEPDERGSYTLLGWEGTDEDGDGLVNEDGTGYYDPNRDWPWRWEPRYVQWGAYRYPFSIRENRLVADFVMARPNIAGAQSYHNSAGMILRGPGQRGASYPGDDVRVFDAIGKKGELMLPGYRYLDVVGGLYPVWGGEFDWFYAMRGAVTYTNELFTPFNLFRKSERDGGLFGSDEQLHAFDRYLLFGDGTIPWREVDHPQHGKVEVGGFKKSWVRQPPSFLLEEECHRNMAFTLYHADQMPKVEVQRIESRPLEGGLREVRAVVGNARLTPTRLQIDRDHRISPPDRIEVAGEGVEVLAGMWTRDPYGRSAEVAEREPARLRVDAIPGMGAVHCRWIVRGEGPVTVTVRSQKGGAATLRE